MRDPRITTHLGLTARALGVEGMLLTTEDKGVVESIQDVATRWGGSFYVKTVSWRNEFKKWKKEGGRILHLTMYGINLPDIIKEVRGVEKLMIVVGAEKVPSEVFDLADWNIAVGNQPHSEVAALAIVLDRLQRESNIDALKLDFGGKIRIVPMERGKMLEERDG